MRDSDRSLDMIEKIRTMTDEEIEEYFATLREKKLKTEHGKLSKWLGNSCKSQSYDTALLQVT